MISPCQGHAVFRGTFFFPADVISAQNEVCWNRFQSGRDVERLSEDSLIYKLIDTFLPFRGTLNRLDWDQPEINMVPITQPKTDCIVLCESFYKQERLY